MARSKHTVHHIRCLFSMSVLSLLGAAWVGSYWNIGYRFSSEELVYTSHGCVVWIHPAAAQRSLWKLASRFRPKDLGWGCGSFDGLSTTWVPAAVYQKYPTGMIQVEFPLWPPVLLISIIVSWELFLRKTWRSWRFPNSCERCLYNLTGNTSDICPECGTPIDKEHNKSSAHTDS
jgi:hypothetical protein